MNRLIKGNNMIANLLIDGDWYPIFCAKSGEFSLQQDEVETSTITSGSSRSYVPGMGNWLLTWQGLTTIDNTEGRISALYLQQQRRTVPSWRVYFEADDGTTQEATFDGMIRGVSMGINGYSYVNANLEVRISGPVSFDDIIAPPGADFDIFSDYWDTVNGQNYISGASTGEWNNGTTYTLTADDIILAVDVEGTDFNKVVGTPTPGEAEFKFQTSPVRIVFPSDLIFDGTQRVFVMWKRV